MTGSVTGRFLGLLLGLALGMPSYAQNNCATGASLVNPELGRAPGLGGTGAMAARPGLGGTGISEGGIGGTGVMAGQPGLGGTGIVGVITGFASICVNGLEVEFDANTPVLDNGLPATSRQLAVGQVVAVHAVGGASAISAASIAVIHAAVGPVDALNRETGEFRVLGQTAWATAPNMLGSVKPGQWVRVSGHRLAQGDIVASRIETIAPQQFAQLSGFVSKYRGPSIEVNGTLVRFDVPRMAAGLTLDREVLISGTWRAGALWAQEVKTDLTQGYLGSAKEVVLEGYVRAVNKDQIDLGPGPLAVGSGVRFVGGSLDQLRANQKVQITGRVDSEQRIRVNRIEFRGGNLSDRQSEIVNSRRRSRGSDDSDDSGRDDRSGRSGSSDDSGSSGRSGSGGSDDSGSGRSGSRSRDSDSDRSGSGGSGRSGGSGSSGGSGGSGGGHD